MRKFDANSITNIIEEYETFKTNIEELKKKTSRISGTPIYGGAQDVERRIIMIYDIELDMKLLRAKENLDKQVEALHEFPLTNALVIFGIFISCLGLHYSHQKY